LVENDINQYDRTLSYTKLAARGGDIRGLETKDGWILWRILRSTMTWYDPHRFETTFQEEGTANSGQVDIRIQDSDNNEILYHERKNEVWEVFQGYSEPSVKVWQKFNGDKMTKLQKDLGEPLVQATTADVFGFTLKGSDSLYQKETGFGRFLIPPFQYTTFDIFNPTGKDVDLSSRYPINMLKVEVLDPKDSDDAALIVQILKGRVRKDVWLWSGGYLAYPWSHTNVNKMLGVEPVKWNGKALTTSDREV